MSTEAVGDFNARRAAIHRRYTDRLKAMSPTDPAYRVLWDERAAKLHALREETKDTP
jgi:hypothetical protein